MKAVLSMMPPRLRRYADKFIGPAGISTLLLASGGAAVWLFLQIAGNSFVRLFSNFVMTRLLEPEAFGLIAIAFSVQSFIDLMTDVGLNTSVIRSDRGDQEKFLRTIWVSKIVRGLLIYALVLVVAYWLSTRQGSMPEDSIWAMEIVPAYLCLTGVAIVISGFTSPSLSLAGRNLDFKRATILALFTSAAKVPVMIIAALMGAGPWSLVLGALAGSVLNVIGSHYFIKGPKMAWEWDRDCFGEVFTFGKWLMIASVAGYLVNQGDRLILATLFDARLFSLYVISMIWLGVMLQMVRVLTRRICLPVISRCRRDTPELLPAIYKRFRLMADAMAAGFFLLLTLGGDLLFTVFYPEQLEAAKEFVPFIAFALLFAPFMLLRQVMLAAGDSRNFAAQQALAAAATFLALPWVYSNFGPYWAAFAFAVNNLVTVPYTMWAANKEMPINLLTEMRILLFGVGAAVVLAMVG